jgi:hypothetical protein
MKLISFLFLVAVIVESVAGSIGFDLKTVTFQFEDSKQIIIIQQSLFKHLNQLFN